MSETVPPESPKIEKDEDQKLREAFATNETPAQADSRIRRGWRVVQKVGPFTVPLLVIGAAIACAFGFAYLVKTADPVEGLRSGIVGGSGQPAAAGVTVQSIVSPTATPEPVYEDILEREIVESINYRRRVVTMPEMGIYSGFVLFARGALEESGYDERPEVAGMPADCSKQCTFQLEYQPDISITVLNINKKKEDVVEAALKMLSEPILSREQIYDPCENAIGVGVKKIAPARYYVVVLTFTPDNCDQPLAPPTPVRAVNFLLRPSSQNRTHHYNVNQMITIIDRPEFFSSLRKCRSYQTYRRDQPNPNT